MIGSYRLQTHGRSAQSYILMTPCYHRIEILTILKEFCTLGHKELTHVKQSLRTMKCRLKKIKWYYLV